MKVFLAVLAAALLPVGANAATITARLIAEAKTQDDPPYFTSNYVFDSEEPLLALISNGSDSTAHPPGDAHINSSVSVNTITGEIKAGVIAMASGMASAAASGAAQITETFAVSGSGILTAKMRLNAAWGSAVSSVVSWSAHVAVAADGVESADYMVNGSEIPFGSVDNYLLEASIPSTAASGGTASISWAIVFVTASSHGTSFLDILNTATIFFDTTDGLTAVPSSSDFLSDPAYLREPSPVPLPASGLLLAFGLLGLRAVRTKRV